MADGSSISALSPMIVQRQRNVIVFSSFSHSIGDNRLHVQLNQSCMRMVMMSTLSSDRPFCTTQPLPINVVSYPFLKRQPDTRVFAQPGLHRGIPFHSAIYIICICTWCTSHPSARCTHRDRANEQNEKKKRKSVLIEFF